MDRMRKIAVAAAVAALVAAVPALVAHAEQKVRIGWNINLGNAPAQIAAERGLFSKHGVDAEVRSFGSGPVLTQAMATKEIDIAYVGFAPAYNWLEKDLKTVALVQSSYGLGSLVVRSDSHINSIAELKGKTIVGSRKGSGNDAILRMLLLREVGKLDPDHDVQIVGMGEQAKGATLLEKKVDAAFLVEPFTSQVLATGQAKILANTVDLAPKHPWYLVVARAEWVKENRGLAAKVIRAHVDAVKLLNAGEATDALVRIFKITPVTAADGKVVSPAEIIKMAKERVGFDYDLKDQEMQFFERQVVWSRTLGFSKGLYKAQDLFDLTLLRDVLAAR
jgi:NitT/TauT family transport system substrate-binding protein